MRHDAAEARERMGREVSSNCSAFRMETNKASPDRRLIGCTDDLNGTEQAGWQERGMRVIGRNVSEGVLDCTWLLVADEAIHPKVYNCDG